MRNEFAANTQVKMAARGLDRDDLVRLTGLYRPCSMPQDT